MNAQDFLGFAEVSCPLLGVLFCLPTMDEVSAGRVLVRRPLLMEPQEFGKHVSTLVLSGFDREPWRILTHALVHQDFEHLSGNAVGLLEHGLWVYMHAGIVGLYGVFLCGVAACGLNRRGRELQTQAMVEGTLPRAPQHLGPLEVPEGARASWQWLREKTAVSVAPLVHRVSSAGGASGGVAGLLGYNTVAALLRLHGQLQEAREPGEGGTLMARPGRRMEFWTSVWALFQGGRFLLQQWHGAAGEEGFTGIDHSGHIHGFSAGAAIALLCEAGRWLRRPRGRRRPRPPDGGNRGNIMFGGAGQRLGQ